MLSDNVDVSAQNIENIRKDGGVVSDWGNIAATILWLRTLT
jgi:hypothetical protein